MRSVLARLSMLGLGLFGCGTSPAAPEAPATSEQPIAGGALDLEHAAVFELFTRWGEQGISSCTASLIAPNLLVTARHCVSPGDHTSIRCGEAMLGSAVGGGSVFVTNDPVPGSNSLFYRGADVRVQPDNDDTCGWDVALVILENSVPSAQALPIVPRIDREAEPGEPYVAIGYGVNERGEQNEGRMLLDDLEVRCSSDCDQRYQVVSNEFMGEAGICSGDSGGPALDADGKVIGVVSRGSDPCSTPIYGSLAAWSDWIVETAFDAARVGGYPAPFWAWSGSSDLAPDLAAAGESCQSSGECQPGHVCYFASDPSLATCTAICENDEQCPEGLICQTGFEVRGGGLCLGRPVAPPPDEPDTMTGDPETLPRAKGRGADDGCAMHGGSAPLGDGLAWLVALALMVGFRWSRGGSNP